MVPLRKPAERSEASAFDPPAGAAAVLDRKVIAPTADARTLQARAQAWAAGETAFPAAEPGRWSARRTLAFAVGASLMLWGGIFMMGWAILRSLG